MRLKGLLKTANFKTKNAIIREHNNLTNQYMMYYGLGGGMMIFGWVTYILVIILLVLGIAALWKYINKK